MKTVTRGNRTFTIYETTNELARVGRERGLTFHACSTTFADNGWTRQVTTSADSSHWRANRRDDTPDGPVWAGWQDFGLDLDAAFAYANA